MKPRSQLRRRLEAEADRTAAIKKRLSTQRRFAVERPRVDVEAIAAYVAALDPARLYRDPRDHVFRFRTKDKGRITSALVAYAYKRFPVPACLDMVWHDPSAPRGRLADVLPIGMMGTRSQARLGRLRAWYLTAAAGGSLYKEHTSRFMTRKETHRFLSGPPMSFEAAIVFAIAQSHTDSKATCHRLGQSKLAQRDLIGDAGTTPSLERHAAFWRDAVRFLAQGELPLATINDMVDFFTHASGEDDYSLKGRTIASVGTAMEQWHRHLARVKRLGNHSWVGVDLPETIYEKEFNRTGNPIDYAFSQVRSSAALAEEGSAMHHCVYSYQPSCLNGRISIWSLKTRPHAAKTRPFERAITFELNHEAEAIVQIRGYANRFATPDEMAIIRRWAGENRLDVRNG